MFNSVLLHMTPARDPKQCFIEALGGGFRRGMGDNLPSSKKHLPTESLPDHEKMCSLKYNMTEFEH